MKRPIFFHHSVYSFSFCFVCLWIYYRISYSTFFFFFALCFEVYCIYRFFFSVSSTSIFFRLLFETVTPSTPLANTCCPLNLSEILVVFSLKCIFPRVSFLTWLSSSDTTLTFPLHLLPHTPVTPVLNLTCLFFQLSFFTWLHPHLPATRVALIPLHLLEILRVFPLGSLSSSLSFPTCLSPPDSTLAPLSPALHIYLSLPSPVFPYLGTYLLHFVIYLPLHTWLH